MKWIVISGSLCHTPYIQLLSIPLHNLPKIPNNTYNLPTLLYTRSPFQFPTHTYPYSTATSQWSCTDLPCFPPKLHHPSYDSIPEVFSKTRPHVRRTVSGVGRWSWGLSCEDDVGWCCLWERETEEGGEGVRWCYGYGCVKMCGMFCSCFCRDGAMVGWLGLGVHDSTGKTYVSREDHWFNDFHFFLLLFRWMPSRKGFRWNSINIWEVEPPTWWCV